MNLLFFSATTLALCNIECSCCPALGCCCCCLGRRHTSFTTLPLAVVLHNSVTRGVFSECCIIGKISYPTILIIYLSTNISTPTDIDFFTSDTSPKFPDNIKYSRTYPRMVTDIRIFKCNMQATKPSIPQYS